MAGEPSGGSFDELLSDLPRGAGPAGIGKPSSARFESPQNVLATPSLRFDAARNTGSQLFLGVLGGRAVTGPRLADGRTQRWIEGGVPIGVGDDRHHLLVAGTRAGKGRSALMPVLCTLPQDTSLLCVDPKGDLARMSARYRAGIGQAVGVLDPFGCSGSAVREFACAYNPVETLRSGDRRTFVANARMIADALVVTGDFKDKHWDETSKQILAGLVAHVATHVNYAGARDLLTVWRLASELVTPDPHDSQKYWLAQEMLASDAAAGMVRAAARQFYDRSGGEFSSVLSNLRKHLDWLSFECMRDVLTGPSIDLRDLKRRNVAYYVTLPAMRMDALRGWLRMIVQMALVACEEEPLLKGNQCVLLLDEFHALGRLSALETAAAQIAGLGAKIYFVVQSFGQFSHYEKNHEIFIANSGTLQVMGCSDETTLKYVSERMGSCLAQTRSSSAPTFEQAAQQGVTGESWSVTGHPLMTPEEVGRYFSRDDKKLRQLVLRPGYHPMVLQRAFYDKHELFRGRYDQGART